MGALQPWLSIISDHIKCLMTFVDFRPYAVIDQRIQQRGYVTM